MRRYWNLKIDIEYWKLNVIIRLRICMKIHVFVDIIWKKEETKKEKNFWKRIITKN